jgi:hypothetical protein
MSKDPCKGCICSTCELSEKQGHLYGCKKRRCQACSENRYLRLTYCPDSLPIEEKGEVIRL